MQATTHMPTGLVGATGKQAEFLARAALDAHTHFHHRADLFVVRDLGDALVIGGSVPSFYLRQVLQTALQTVVGPRRIDNQVAVVSSDGLSSVGAGDE
jgi:hypothetical protein